MTVATREGPKADITLTDQLTVATVKKVDLAAIVPNTYVGIATRTGATANCGRSRCWCFPRRCAAPVRDTTLGI